MHGEGGSRTGLDVGLVTLGTPGDRGKRGRGRVAHSTGMVQRSDRQTTVRAGVTQDETSGLEQFA